MSLPLDEEGIKQACLAFPAIGFEPIPKKWMDSKSTAYANSAKRDVENITTFNKKFLLSDLNRYPKMDGV